MGQTAICVKVDIPAPFLEHRCSGLAPLVLHDRVGVTVAHEDIGFLHLVSKSAPCDIDKCACLVDVLLGYHVASLAAQQQVAGQAKDAAELDGASDA